MYLKTQFQARLKHLKDHLRLERSCAKMHEVSEKIFAQFDPILAQKYQQMLKANADLLEYIQKKIENDSG